MEKIQLADELDFIKVYNKDDLRTESSSNKVFESFNNILNSHQKSKDSTIDLSTELDTLSNKISLDFLSASSNLAFILCSKKDCEGNNRRSISFLYLSSMNKTDKFWNLSSIINRYGYDINFQKTLILSSFEYLLNKKAETVVINCDLKNKDMIKFYDSLISEKFIINNGSLPELSTTEEPSHANSKTVQYLFNLKTFNKNPKNLIEVGQKSSIAFEKV